MEVTGSRVQLPSKMATKQQILMNTSTFLQTLFHYIN